MNDLVKKVEIELHGKDPELQAAHACVEMLENLKFGGAGGIITVLTSHQRARVVQYLMDRYGFLRT